MAGNRSTAPLLIVCLLLASQERTTEAFSTKPIPRTQYAAPWVTLRPTKPLTGLSRRVSHILTTIASSDDGEAKVGIFKSAKQKFAARPGTYLMIPVIAAVVGWFTNYLAVQMIFYPVEFRGIPLYVRPEVPLGLLGWQGIVPCKTKTMSIALCEMVTSQLLTVSEAFNRLNPVELANLLASRVPTLGVEIVSETFPKSLASWPVRALRKFSHGQQPSALRFVNVHFLTQMIKDMQHNIDAIFSLENCVVGQMVEDRAKLGELFRNVGQKELDFLTNSGLWFGFLLGLIQLAVALVWDNPWSLSIGGGIVGLATNWLALKWIFEPINPTRVGPFILQGQFLRRQKEVAAEFSKFFADKILSSPKLWNSMLTDPATTPALFDLLRVHFQKVGNIVSFGLARGAPSAQAIDAATRSVSTHQVPFCNGHRVFLLLGLASLIMNLQAISNLPNHVHVLHNYIDKTMGLEHTLRTKMEAMTPARFERVLHPIFEEDELTLILAGAVLGFAAGLIQQGLETGAIKLPNPFPRIKAVLVQMANRLQRLLGRSDLSEGKDT